MAIFASKKLRNPKWTNSGVEDLKNTTVYKAYAVDTLEEAKELLSAQDDVTAERYHPYVLHIREKDRSKAFAIMLEVYAYFQSKRSNTAHCLYPMHVVLPNI